jgi:hypothetical protein
MTILKYAQMLTRMVLWVIAFGSPDSFVMDEKTYTSKFKVTKENKESGTY